MASSIDPGTAATGLETHCREIATRARRAAIDLAAVPGDRKAACLRAAAAAIRADVAEILAANRKMFEFAKAAGIRTFSADPDPDSFDSLHDLVKEFDVRIAIHNHGPGHRYNKAVDVLRAVEKYDQRIGACADLGHYIRSGERPVDVIRVLAGRLYGVHLKDFAEMQDKTSGVILGKGHLDVPGVFAALEQVGFPADGALSLEYEEHPENPLADIRECLEVARSALAAA